MTSKQELEEHLSLTKKSERNEVCPIKSVLELIGGKWKMRILYTISREEISRFNELKRHISGITNTMLSNSLHELENDKFITRTQYNEMPLRVEYTLTDLGESFLPLFNGISSWWDNYSSYKTPEN